MRCKSGSNSRSEIVTMFPSSPHHSSLAHRLAMLLLSTGALPPTRYPKRCSKKLPKKISEEVFQKLFNKFANRISEVQIFSQMYFRRPISSKYISEVQILSSKILKAPYPGFLKFRQHGSADRLRVPPRPHGEQPGRRLQSIFPRYGPGKFVCDGAPAPPLPLQSI